MTPRTRYLLSINEETVGGYCELLWRKGVGEKHDAVSATNEGEDDEHIVVFRMRRT
jgi:hypothetical protein